MFCTQCGKEINDGAAFCSGCGSKVAEIPSEPVEREPQADEASQLMKADGDASGAEDAKGAAGVEDAKEAGGVHVAEDVTPENAQVSTVPQVATAPMPAGEYTLKKSSSKTAAIILAVAAVALAGVVGGVVYFNFFAPYAIDETTFPDRSLRSYVNKKIDRDDDGKLSRDEAKEVTEINLSESGVEDLTGFELFPNLEKVNVSDCADLKSADFSKNVKITEINCAASGLGSIDVTVLPELTKLDISNTEIEELDVSKCPKLEDLEAAGTKLTDVDLSANAALTALSLSQETSVDGLEATGVRAQYQLIKADASGVLGVILPTAQQAPETGSRATTYSYDANHNLTSEVRQSNTENGKGSDERNFEYDSDGRIVRTVSGSSRNSKSSVGTFEYDPDGKLVQYTIGSSKNYLSWDGDKLTGINNWTVSYDDQGRASQLKQASGSYTTTISFEYGTNGKISDITYTGSGGSSGSTTTSYECDYDAQGNCVEMRGSIQNYPGSQPIAYKAVFEYDGMGNMVSATYMSGDKVTGSLTYEYDDDGNLTKRTVQNNTENFTGDSRTKYASGTTTFTYRREFTKTSAPDFFDASEQFLMNPSYQQYTRVLDVAPFEDQAYPVRQMLSGWFNYGYY